ncbi:predicted protein [Naegleria gruberi]|uniref:Predicted protein n=1 Tax=Naegleria gruberi TaxID=5762 RepID=D2V4T6_NAEGR|nr:uncharacterized protein NAEGRDRAFT_63902 [Naegleria gruberi]EFC48159.1 predicted protein [Naegleria gruberi]|eukprot:XP_002680903.1 predicted protein [Naegleria gruberi strain NEG-M]
MSLKQPLLSKTTREEIDAEEDDSIYYENRSRANFQYTLQGVQRKEPLPAVVDNKSITISESDYLLGKSSNSSSTTPSYMTNISTVQTASDALQQALRYRNSFIEKQQEILKEVDSFVSSLKSEIIQLKEKNKALENELNECKKAKQSVGCGKRQVFCIVAAIIIPILLLVAILIILMVIFGKDLFCQVKS